MPMRKFPAMAVALVLSASAVAAAPPPAPAASHGASVLEVLGRRVLVHYGPEVSNLDRSAIDDAFASAAELLDRHAKDFNAGETLAISQIHTVTVTDSPTTCLGETGGHSMRLSVHYLRSVSAAWLASIFGHEGQHFLDAGHYSGVRLWQDEQKATETQLGIAKALGFDESVIRYLENWARRDNRVALQQHMEQGYPPHCQTRQS